MLLKKGRGTPLSAPTRGTSCHACLVNSNTRNNINLTSNRLHSGSVHRPISCKTYENQDSYPQLP